MTSRPTRRSRSAAPPRGTDGVIAESRKKARTREPAPATLVEVAGFALNEKEHERLQRLQQRVELRNPAAFKLELYEEFAGEGFIEVIENDLRSCYTKCGVALRAHLAPLSAFFALRAKDAAAALGDGNTLVDLLLEVLSSLWRLALSDAVAGTEDNFEMVRRFRETCVDQLELYADWSWLEESDFEPVEARAVPGAVREVIQTYLAGRFPWVLDDEKQMLERQSEFVITPKMLEALRADAVPVAGTPKPAAGPSSPVMAALRKIR